MAQPEVPGPTSSFAALEDMEKRTNGAIPASRPGLDKALAAASRRIRNYCGWHIWPSVEVVDLRIRAAERHPIWLPTTHLTALGGISNAGVALDADALELVDWTEGGEIGYLAWSSPTLVTFTHGYAEVPEDLLELTLELATGGLQTAAGAIREQTLSSSVTWARSSARLTADDRDALAPYKIGYQP